MAEAVTRRIIELDVKTSSEALRAIKAQAEMMRNLEKSIDAAKDSLRSFAEGVVSAFSFHAAVDSIKEVLKAMGDTVDASTRLGLSVQQLQEWNHAAESSSATAEDLAAGIKGMSKSMAGMQDATTASTKALKKFGVSATDSTDTALTKIAEGFSKLQDGPLRTALALDIFGKAGEKLIPLLASGAEGIAAMKKEAHELGIVFSDEAAAAAKQFNDELDRIAKISRGTRQQITEGLLPSLNAIASTFLDIVKEKDSFKDFGDGVGQVLLFVTGMAIKSVATFKAFVVLMAGMSQILNQTSLKGIKEQWKLMTSEIDKLGDEANQRLADLEARYNKNKAGFMGPPAPPKAAGGVPDILGNKKTEDDIKALEKYIEATNKVGVAERELTQVQALAVLVQKDKLNVTSASEQALYKQAQAAATMADLRKTQIAQEKADVAAGEKRNQDLVAEIKRIDNLRQSMIDAADPVEAIKRKMAELDEVLAKTVNPDDIQRLERYGAALEEAFGKATGSAVDFARTFKDNFESLGTSVGKQVQSWATDVTDAIVNMAETGKLNVKDMVNSMLADMARMLVQKQLQPVFTDLANWAKTSINTQHAQGSVFDRSGVQAFASGGVVSGPTVFGMAGGGVGLMGEAGPEAVMPLKRNASGDLGVSAAPVNVTVINNNGSQIKTEETRGAGGQRQLQIMVDTAVEESLGKGRFDRVMSTSYGVARKGR